MKKFAVTKNHFHFINLSLDAEDLNPEGMINVIFNRVESPFDTENYIEFENEAEARRYFDEACSKCVSHSRDFRFHVCDKTYYKETGIEDLELDFVAFETLLVDEDDEYIETINEEYYVAPIEF